MINPTIEDVVRERKALSLYPSFYIEEAKLLKDVTEFIEMINHAKVIRQNASLRSGISDLLICYYGRFVAIELKDATGTPSQPQIKFLMEIGEAGGANCICTTVQEVYEVLKLSLN